MGLFVIIHIVPSKNLEIVQFSKWVFGHNISLNPYQLHNISLNHLLAIFIETAILFFNA